MMPRPVTAALFKRVLAPVLVAALVTGLAACGRSGKESRIRLPEAQVNTLGVNAYLWRAALETLGFMPMAQVDSNGGVILSDWYANPQTPSERVKVSVFVLDADLRADAIKVNVQRQEARGGTWTDATVRAGTVQKLEEAILTRARQIRQGSVN